MDAYTFDDDDPRAEMEMAAIAWGLDPWQDDYASGCGVCGCCPCGVPGCPDCPTAAPDTSPYGLDVPMVHGIRDTHAVVTRGAARARRILLSGCPDFADLKRRTHRRHRRAWRKWVSLGETDAPESTPRPLTGWEVA